MNGSTFAQKVNANGLGVGGRFFIQDKARFDKELNLDTAKIGDQLNMIGSTFAKVSANGLRVDQSLLMRNSKFNGEVNLSGADIQGNLEMDASIFTQAVSGDSLQVRGDLFIRRANFKEATLLINARLSESLDLRGSALVSLDLLGARIAGDLRLAGEGLTTTWQSSAQNEPGLILSNAQVGALQDTLEAWPRLIDLEGFRYSRLGGLIATNQSNDARNRPLDDWIKWLKKDRANSNRYSPQPYTQLASVLVAAGRRDQANDILFAGRERERRSARKQGRWGQWLWLTILAKVCGYGIGSYTFHVLRWIVGSTAVGTAVLWHFVPAAQVPSRKWLKLRVV